VPSLRHQALTRIVPVLRHSGEVHGDEEVARLRADVLARQADHDDSAPTRVASRFDVSRTDVAGMPVHELRLPGTSPRRTVLYVHGGGFVGGLDRFHWRYAARLATRLGVRVLLPSYPLAPTHTWEDAVPPLLALFEQAALEAEHGVVMMGDSSGGGLALLLAQTLARGSGPQPTHLVLISPWLDLTGETPGTEDAARADRWLNLTKLKVYGAWWGAGDPPAPEASPLSNSLDDLPPTLVLCGTADLLVPQARALAERARSEGVDLTYVEQRGLMHVYPILPVPEARAAFETVAAFVGAG
jgi:monoterpene epsilon-lactone hydrolase